MSPSLPPRSLPIALICVGMIAAVGASATPTTEEDAASLRPAAPSIPLDVDPLELTPAMRRFLEEKAEARKSSLGRLHDLMDALFDPEKGLGIEYGSTGTRTAARTFEEAEGNCLSFTLLFVSLARELDLRAHFVEVAEVVGWSRRGPTTFGHWHIYSEIEVDNALVLVDFLPVDERRYFQRRRIDETRVRAHFHNNLGAELLADGHPAEALRHLEKARTLDSTFVPAAVNLAVAHRRAGRTEEAENLLRVVLADDPRNSQAATNLAALLTLQGRDEEAGILLKRARTYLQKNPFHHFELAMSAMDAGDLETARERMGSAIRRRPGEAVFHERMAEILLRLNEDGEALRRLERAVELESDPERRERLARRIEELRADSEISSD